MVITGSESSRGVIEVSLSVSYHGGVDLYLVSLREAREQRVRDSTMMSRTESMEWENLPTSEKRIYTLQPLNREYIKMLTADYNACSMQNVTNVAID